MVQPIRILVHMVQIFWNQTRISLDICLDKSFLGFLLDQKNEKAHEMLLQYYRSLEMFEWLSTHIPIHNL